MTNKKEGNNQVSNPNRRKFVKNTGMVLGGVIGGSLLGGLVSNFGDDEQTTTSERQLVDSQEARMFFTREDDFRVLMQATECIFPEDENGPGAIKLGVPYFIDKQLASSWGNNSRDYRLQLTSASPDATVNESMMTRGEIFLDGIRKINDECKKKYNVSFDEANEEEQIKILEKFDKGEVKMKAVSSSSFFELLRITTLEGAYSDPLYGGNRNMEGWKMKEFPGAVPSYIDIIEKDEFVKMDPISLMDYQNP